VSLGYPRTKGIALCASFAVLLAVSSVISLPIPFSPVPVTLQVLVVLIISMILGPAYGTLCCLLYLVLGAVGLPVFHGGTSGIPILLGPTGGFLFAFPLSALVGGAVARRLSKTQRSDALRVCAGAVLSVFLIYVVGTTWLSAYLGINLYQAFLVGGLPFIPFDIVKAIVAVPVVMRLRWSGMDLPVNRG
jgi:biotin transport system substrate-specific component